MQILVTRPDPSATAARWRALGHDVTEAPLLVTRPLDWEPPAAMPAAIAFTSTNGVRFAGAGAKRFAALPVFTVGTATMTAASAAGWPDVRYGGGTAAALFDWIVAAGLPSVLHLAGADRAAVKVPPELTVTIRDVYAAVLAPLNPAAVTALAAGTIDVVPLYSARTAAQFASETDRAGIDRGMVAVTAISAAVARAAGPGWRSVTTAAAPTADALFAATLRVCDKAATLRGE